MPRFERSDDKMFWEIERDGCSVATQELESEISVPDGPLNWDDTPE